MSRTVGAWLATGRLRHGDLQRVAQHVGVTPRTLRNWRDREGGKRSPGRGPGRPRQPTELAWCVLRAVVRAWRALPRGHNGWRPLCDQLARLLIDVSTRWVQAIVKRLKADRARQVRRRIERERTHVLVLARNALWSSDESLVDRDEHGRATLAAAPSGRVRAGRARARAACGGVGLRAAGVGVDHDFGDSSPWRARRAQRGELCRVEGQSSGC